MNEQTRGEVTTAPSDPEWNDVTAALFKSEYGYDAIEAVINTSWLKGRIYDYAVDSGYIWLGRLVDKYITRPACKVINQVVRDAVEVYADQCSLQDRSPIGSYVDWLMGHCLSIVEQAECS